MKKYIFLILYFASLFFMSGCKNNKQPNDENIYTSIEKINVLFYNYLFESPMSISCNSIKKEISSMDTIYVYDYDTNTLSGEFRIDNQGVFEVELTEAILLKEIEKELLKLSPADSTSTFDARISCMVKYKNGKCQKLCIGGYFSEDISYQEINQKRNNRLLYLIKNNIGYYSWMSRSKYIYMKELQDVTFKREAIIDYKDVKYIGVMFQS